MCPISLVACMLSQSNSHRSLVWQKRLSGYDPVVRENREAGSAGIRAVGAQTRKQYKFVWSRRLKMRSVVVELVWLERVGRMLSIVNNDGDIFPS